MKIGFGVKLLILASVLLLGSVAAYAKITNRPDETSIKFDKGETGTVQYVIDGDSLVLQGGLRVSLAAIQAPKRAWPEKNLKGWPLADDARAKLKSLIAGRAVQLYYSGDQRDRYGRALAQVWIIEADGREGVWLQEEVLKAGMARVYTWPGQTLDTPRLYKAEAAARAAKRGIWNTRTTNGFYALRNPDPNPLSQYVDSVQIVEGLIISAADVRGTIYLNFGSDYRTDFTIAISKKNSKAFKKAHPDPLTLEGARVRVRGYIELMNGPIIWLGDPNRLEVLD